MDVALFHPVMQAGFAGMCFILLGALIWTQKRSANQSDLFVKHIIAVVERNTQVITANTSTMQQHEVRAVRDQKRQSDLLHKIDHNLATRPCVVQNQKGT